MRRKIIFFFASNFILWIFSTFLCIYKLFSASLKHSLHLLSVCFPVEQFLTGGCVQFQCILSSACGHADERVLNFMMLRWYNLVSLVSLLRQLPRAGLPGFQAQALGLGWLRNGGSVSFSWMMSFSLRSTRECFFHRLLFYK